MRWSRRGNRRMAPTFLHSTSGYLGSCTPTVLLSSKSKLLKFLFWSSPFIIYIETMAERALTHKRKKITCDSQEDCLSKSARLMKQLPQKQSVLAKGYEMWLIIALELWLTVHSTIHGKREACGATEVMSFHSRVWFCFLANGFGIAGCPAGQQHFMEHALRMWSLWATKWEMLDYSGWRKTEEMMVD